jgi:hypothetical protein
MSGSKTVAAIVAAIVGGIVAACVAFVVVLFLVRILWDWTIPDLFPGAVEQGLVARSITWLTACKVAIFVAVLSGIAGLHVSYRKDRAGGSKQSPAA